VVQLCGRFVVELDGRRVEDRLPGRQGRLLFAYLALSRDRRVGRNELVEALWGAELPRDPADVLAAVLSKVRAAVGNDVVEGRGDVRLVLPAGATVDVERADAQADPASTLPIHFTATFDEPVHAFTSGVTLGGTADTSGATVTITQLTSTTYDIAVDDVTGSGTVTASLDAGATTDLAGNSSTASTSTDNSVDYEPGP